MVREAVEITAAESASVEVKEPRVLDSLLDAELKLNKKIVSKLVGNSVIFPQDFIQVRLDAPVKPNFHGAGGRRRVRRK